MGRRFKLLILFAFWNVLMRTFLFWVCLLLCFFSSSIGFVELFILWSLFYVFVFLIYERLFNMGFVLWHFLVFCVAWLSFSMCNYWLWYYLYFCSLCFLFYNLLFYSFKISVAFVFTLFGYFIILFASNVNCLYIDVLINQYSFHLGFFHFLFIWPLFLFSIVLLLL